MTGRLERLIGVIRVSTDEQAQDGRAGLDRQEATVRGIAERYGAALDLVRIEGVSGTDVIRSREWREQVQPHLGKAGVAIAVDAIDRLCRVDRFDFAVLQAVYDSRTLIYTPSGASDARDMQGYLTLGMGALFGGIERMQILRRQQDAKEVKRRRGEWVGPLSSLPIGTTYDRARRRWGLSDDAARVRLAFEIVDGGGALREATRRAGFPTLTTTKTILRNPIYSGWLVFDRERDMADSRVDGDGRKRDRRKVPRAPERVIRVQVYGLEGQAEPVVPLDVFERVQVVLASKRASMRKVQVHGAALYPYSGFLASGEVVPQGYVGLDVEPHRIYGHQSGRAKPVYYVCSCRQAQGLRCAMPGLLATRVNQAVDDYLVWLTSGDRLVDAYREQRAPDPVPLFESAEKDLLEATAKAQRLAELFVDGAIARTVYDRQYRAIQAELSEASRRVAELRLEVQARAAQSTEHRLRDLAFDAAWTPAAKREWLRANIESIVIGRAGIHRAVVRVPGTSASVDVGAGRAWPAQPSRVERLELDGKLLVSHLGRELGISAAQARRLADAGRLPEAAGVVGRQRYWTADQVPAARAMLAENPIEPASAKWKRRGLLTSHDVCRELAVASKTFMREVRAKTITPHDRRGRILLWHPEQLPELRRVLARE